MAQTTRTGERGGDNYSQTRHSVPVINYWLSLVSDCCENKVSFSPQVSNGSDVPGVGVVI